MKKKFLWVFAIIIICMSCFFACSPLELSGGPNIEDTVYGNGGTSVVKGNYLYFTNAYKNYNDIEVGENDYDDDDTKSFAIYRTRLNSSGAVDVDENGNPSGAELLVPLICGYEKSGLYICGDYLYYTTPYSVKFSGGNGETKTGYLRFEKVKLNGKDRTVLSEGEYTKDCEYNINYINNTTYITIFGKKNPSSTDTSSSENKNADIHVIKSSGGNHKQYEITTSASSYATYLQEDVYYGKNIEEVNKYVYYTKNEDSKYSLYRTSLDGGNRETLINRSLTEIKLVAVKNNRVYYKQDNVLYSSSSFATQDKKTYTTAPIADDATTGITDFVILDDSIGSGAVDRGILVVTHNNNLYEVSVRNGVQGSQKKDSFVKLYKGEKQIDLVFTKGSQVFYTIKDDESKILHAFDFTGNDNENKHYNVLYNFSTSIDDDSSVSIFDYDFDRIFFFAKVENSNKNLNYLQVALLENNIYKNSDNNSVANYIGVLDASDVKKD